MMNDFNTRLSRNHLSWPDMLGNLMENGCNRLLIVVMKSFYQNLKAVFKPMKHFQYIPG